MKMKTAIVLAVVVLDGAALAFLSMENPGETLHAWSHSAGLCRQDHGSSQGFGCDSPAPAAAAERYSADELEAIRWVADRIISEGTLEISVEDFEEETGLRFDALERDGLTEERLKMGVLAEMRRRNFDVDQVAGAGHCARFSACSIRRDLSSASGEELARYESEKARDGEAPQGFLAPDFTVPATSGGVASLADYRGRKVALVFLAGHCHHCLRTLPVLDDLQTRLGDELDVVPVYINSGSVEDVRRWSDPMDLGFPLLVADSEDLSDSYDFRMVPTIFLVDRDGHVVRRLVGQKAPQALESALVEFAGS